MFKTIAIIGVGLLGGSFAKAIRAFLPNTKILGVDKYTLKTDIFDEFSTSLKICNTADLVIIATPPIATIEVLNKLPKNILKMDLGSVKAYLKPYLHLNLTPAHPIAGTQKSGYKNSSEKILQNRTIIFTKQDEKLYDFARQIGMKPAFLDADEHDKIYAAVSHFPQLLAYWHASLGFEINASQAGEFNRLKESPYPLWLEIFKLNRQNIAKLIEDFTAKTGAYNLHELHYFISNYLANHTPHEFLPYAGTGFYSMSAFANIQNTDYLSADLCQNIRHFWANLIK
jgi:prephenate dehydrogenase